MTLAGLYEAGGTVVRAGSHRPWLQRMDRRRFCAAMIATMFGSRPLFAEPEVAAQDIEKQVADLMSLMNQAAGGKQFWADVWFFHDWLIQCHALTGHYRLLDGSNRRHASGTYELCRDKMDEIRTRDKLPPMEGKAIVVLHGLFRTRSSMATLGSAPYSPSACHGATAPCAARLSATDVMPLSAPGSSPENQLGWASFRSGSSPSTNTRSPTSDGRVGGEGSGGGAP